MQFNTLEHSSINDITQCLNQSFADYEIAIQWTEDSMRQKIKIEDIEPALSVGAFDGGQLIGSTLIGVDEELGTKRAWDGGTGVVPEYRGQKLTERMFEYILPRLQQAGIKMMLLEVLENNKTAYKIYERLGFKPTRLLRAYKGDINAAKGQEYNVEVLTNYNADELLSLSDWQPAWQQMNKRILNRGDAVTTICIKVEDKIVAYAHYDRQAKRVWQFAVATERRRNGMATALFNHIAGSNNEPWLITNIDAGSENTNGFLSSIGLKNIISQYEMVMDL